MSPNGSVRGLVSLTIVCSMALGPAAAGTVSLLWNPSSGATGYKVYSGSSSNPYATGASLTLGNVVQTTFSTMPNCVPTYFQVTAFNSAGESGPSNEISTWPRPTLTGANPALGPLGQPLAVVISGNNFQPGATVQFSGSGVTVGAVTRNACDQITAAISIGSTAALGPVQISVVNVNGVTGTATGLFCVGTCDPTPPSASMTAPAAGSTVSGSVTVSATASDNVGVVGVQFLLDGAALGAEDTTAPYGFLWDTTTTANGSHTLSARARDAAGNTATAPNRTVTVSNGAPLPAVQNLRRTDTQ